jgi:hypothetical protein
MKMYLTLEELPEGGPPVTLTFTAAEAAVAVGMFSNAVAQVGCMLKPLIEECGDDLAEFEQVLLLLRETVVRTGKLTRRFPADKVAIERYLLIERDVQLKLEAMLATYELLRKSGRDIPKVKREYH